MVNNYFENLKKIKGCINCKRSYYRTGKLCGKVDICQEARDFKFFSKVTYWSDAERAGLKEMGFGVKTARREGYDWGLRAVTIRHFVRAAREVKDSADGKR